MEANHLDNELAAAINEWNTWYCKHGYYEGRDCLDCDVPTHLPPIFNNDPGDENDFDVRTRTG